MAEKISVENLKEKINDLVILDVRELDELEGGKIDTCTHMPLGLAIRNANKGEIDDLKDKKICTYCRNGYRGNIAADELIKKGFDAVTLDGGFMAWEKT